MVLGVYSKGPTRCGGGRCGMRTPAEATGNGALRILAARLQNQVAKDKQPYIY